MTLWEKLKERHPGTVAGNPADSIGCPGEYDFLNTPCKFGLAACRNTPQYNQGADPCEACWSQEYVPTRGEAPAAAEKVDHPSHYNTGRFECIDEMVALFGVEDVKAFCRCNVHKYRYRAQAKNGAEDLAKAEWYMAKLVELEGLEGTV